MQKTPLKFKLDKLSSCFFYFLIAMSISLLSACGLGSTDSETQADINTQANAKTDSREQKFKLGGQIIGLNGVLILSNGDQQIELDKNSSFLFEKNMSSGDRFEIKIESRPQNQICELQNATGIINANNVTSVVVICNREAINTTLSIKISATGLTGPVTINSNNGNSFKVLQNGESEFQVTSNALNLSPFSISDKPSTQNCQILNLSAIDAMTTLVSFDLSCRDIPTTQPLD